MVPTILQLHGISMPAQMQGRVLSELLISGKTKADATGKKNEISATVKRTWGSYTVTMQTVEWKNHRYINFIRATRVVQ